MVVDWLRSCYRSNWRLFTDSTTETPGVYYFSPPGASHFPGYHHLGSAVWNPTDPGCVQGLGEVITSRRQHYNGIWDSIYPQSRFTGSLDCFAEGESIEEAANPDELYHGYPLECFVPILPAPPIPPTVATSNWGRASAFDQRAVQLLYARVIEAMYADDVPTINAILGEFFTDSPAITFHPAEGNMPAVTTVIGADYAIAIADGTRNAQQLAMQAFQGIQSPTDFGVVETIPLWYQASNHIHATLEADGANLIGRVMLVGHSYGGAAQLILAARYRHAQTTRPVIVLTYGAPKAGGPKVSALLEKVSGASLANDNDLITALPPDPATLASIAPLFPLVSFLPWYRWTRSPHTWTVDVEGKIIPGPNVLLDFQTLFNLVDHAVNNTEQNSILGHSIGEYVRRLMLAVPVANWPLSETVLDLINDEQEVEAGSALGVNLAPWESTGYYLAGGEGALPSPNIRFGSGVISDTPAEQVKFVLGGM